MLLMKRLAANFVDIFVVLAVIVLFLMFVLPLFVSDGQAPLWAAGFGLILIGFTVFILQYPFMLVNQTIGKALMGLRIASTNHQRPLTVSIILQRELFAKALTCYLMCLPVLIGKEGQHDVACETQII